ncbi:kinase/pyrophosphorylase [Tuanshanicoccus lijuaniae]|uniref:pyruvate, water dikinase regulatory protein n=1 Tax=Aerococcaceae bacterium zg-1292 TaxID=2774330 RepID=UPI0019362CC7|nr:kinase/pyrophosphorylase [Aerococcaceae bacterium zg-1292]MBF6978088.1 kinase/pyrophosphorylase [Aerococcaceae bacterium zg-BR22]QQA37618.1 kinase/pyrophosphorylase [Aerococcaceae bacterium zg-1292]
MTTDTTIHIYLISDSIGETATKFARASIAQFPTANTVLHKFVFISNKESLIPVLEDAKSHDAIVLVTLADKDLTRYSEEFCREHQIFHYNLIQPVTQEIARRTGLEPTHKIGAQHDLSEEYFNRVEAMEFCMMYDDGKDPKGFIEADIVLLGISRTSKTPLSMYLATLGYKVANLPLIPENTLPDILFDLDTKKIVGLTTFDTVANMHRENRMREYGMPSGTRYASMERVNEELKYAHDLYDKLDCLVINTAERSIEETASIIIQKLDLPFRV